MKAIDKGKPGNKGEGESKKQDIKIKIQTKNEIWRDTEKHTKREIEADGNKTKGKWKEGRNNTHKRERKEWK